MPVPEALPHGSQHRQVLTVQFQDLIFFIDGVDLSAGYSSALLRRASRSQACTAARYFFRGQDNTAIAKPSGRSMTILKHRTGHIRNVALTSVYKGVIGV